MLLHNDEEYVQQVPHLAASANMQNNSQSLPSFREFVELSLSPTPQQHVCNMYSNRVASSSQQQDFSTLPLTNNLHELACNMTKLKSFQHVNYSEDRMREDACVVDVHGIGKINWKSSRLTHDQTRILSSKIMSLESKLNMQELELSRLAHENESLKKRKLDKLGMISSIPAKKKSTTPVVQQTLNVILENISEMNQDLISGKIEEYQVVWESQDYVILNAFNNRDEIFNYYCPLYESKFPAEKILYRLVLEREDYRKLFKENQHLLKFYKSRAWRISIFSMKFFNFVRNSKLKKVL